jgi:small GTP-binding protein
MDKRTADNTQTTTLLKSTDRVVTLLVVLIGDAAVGKSCLLNRYIKGMLSKQKTPTIGVEFATKVVPLRNNVFVKAQMWDTAGQEKYRAMTTTYV